ncbi:hypothetical protein B0H63DRAFT_455217 [Podospora didyma]|uniref:Ecp2 effector protein domain-containing protein n=1 Tax=Podospora didyma TaxID=330526 RepID=A0AAE0K2W6_9PEZI|nr:hypothetical protein B0H63DRAFT_455217 [Podospora didyma]
MTSHLLLFLLSALQALGQTPGPIWPNCTAVSHGHWGYEFLWLSYKPIMPGREDARDAVLWIDAVNLADGLRIMCYLFSDNTTSPSPHVVLTNGNREGCGTYLADRWEELSYDTPHAESPAAVAFDAVTRRLSIEQTWKCWKDEAARLAGYHGIAEAVVDMDCWEGREGEREQCQPKSIGGDAGVYLFGEAMAVPEEE